MMKVKVLVKIPKTVDGAKVPGAPFYKGNVIDLPDALAEKWINSKMVERFVPPAPTPAPETQAQNVTQAKKKVAKKKATAKAKTSK